MEPKPIEPQDIRVGMRVRCEWSFCDVDHTADYTVDNIVDGTPYSIGGVTMLGVGPNATWTLLADAPKPTPERCSSQHAGRACDRPPHDGGPHVCYHGDVVAMWGDPPIPAFDPAVLWPRAVVATVCRASTVDHESSRYYQCDRVQDHDGPHVEHVDAEARYVWGDPR